MDYHKEFETVSKGTGETWKPELGQYELEILDEPIPDQFVQDDGKVTDQIKLYVKVNGSNHIWYVSKGKTLASTYGQLMAIGKFKGQLKYQKLNIIVSTGNKGKNQYTITQALEYIKNAQIIQENMINK